MRRFGCCAPCYANCKKIKKGCNETQDSWTVYVHINNKNGKKYVGITSRDPDVRWAGGRGYSTKLPIGRALNKYGWDNFEHKILFSNIDECTAKLIEKQLIQEWHTQDDNYGYNITSGGDGVPGLKHTDESKRKMSLSKSGANHPNYGCHLSDSTKEKIRDRLVGNTNAAGCIRSNETRAKMARAKYKPVASYLDGSIVCVYESALCAEQRTGINRKNISLCCYGKRRHAGGYAWKFA